MPAYSSFLKHQWNAFAEHIAEHAAKDAGSDGGYHGDNWPFAHIKGYLSANNRENHQPSASSTRKSLRK